MAMNSQYQSLIRLSFLILTIVGVVLLGKVGIEYFASISDVKALSGFLTTSENVHSIKQNPISFSTIGFNIDNNDNFGDIEKKMNRGMHQIGRFAGHFSSNVTNELIKRLWFYGFVLTIGALLAGACGIFAFFRSAKIGGIGLLTLGLVFLIWWIDVEPGVAGILLLLSGLGFLVFDVLFPRNHSSFDSLSK